MSADHSAVADAGNFAGCSWRVVVAVVAQPGQYSAFACHSAAAGLADPTRRAPHDPGNVPHCSTLGNWLAVDLRAGGLAGSAGTGATEIFAEGQGLNDARRQQQQR